MKSPDRFSSFSLLKLGGGGSAKKQGGGGGDLIGGAMSAYKMFSGGSKGGAPAEGQAAGGASSGGDMIGNAMKAYKMFSGGKGSSTGGGGGGLLDNIGSFLDRSYRCERHVHSLP